ncbi:autophagy 18h-like protein [Actinidia rufa]|uniref:Autophagy 18h-like protein n=1 Tax=Actinidia rufa TaxID=165716 RepID=A0A7J0EZW7_9ERIC|nr:autophagy 18h-like protein [Actinidia rufa]
MKKTLESNKTTTTNRFFPNSLRFISSCIKTVSSNVRSAGASVAGSISGDSDEHRKDQVLWASFDKVELGPSSIKHVLLLGYSNGFQVLDVEDAPNFSELVSRRDDPVTFLQMQPTPSKSEGHEGFITSHPLLLVVASDETRSSGPMQNARDVLVSRDGYVEPQMGNLLNSPTVVRFYSLRSHNYVHVLRFRSTVYMVRCSPRIVAVGLAAQIYCFDALTLESKFSVLTYPVPQLVSPGLVGVNIGNGPMAVGPRWLAYASNNPLSSNTGRLSPQSLSPSPGVSPSTSPSNGSLGYKTFTKYYHDLLPDGSSSPVSSNSGWKVGRAATQSTETDTAGTVVIRDFVSKSVVSQFRAHTSPISALCFDPSGTLLVTASVHGNNINVFRIMPSQNGSGTRSYDWSCSHVHLYKLHRGMTSAVIQDIFFSRYSQWVAIVSSRGTCHIFVLSPFGGETGLQIQNSHVDGPSLIPVLSQPWWSSSSLMISQQSSPSPPAPITLSVVSRIRLGNSGWLNTVSNAASSAAGKVSVPSGSVAAIFHSSVHHHMQPAPSNVNALEHLLVYSPSGNVIQYELRPSVGENKLNLLQELGQVHWYRCKRKKVQIPSGKIPIWQKSKFLGDEEQNLTKDHIGREIEIEKIPVHEVEVKRKDLLPVFDRFHRIHSEWSNDSAPVVGKYSTSSSTSHGGKEKFSEGSLGTSAAVHDLNQADSLRPYPCIVLDANENDGVKGKNAAALLFSCSEPKISALSTGKTIAREGQSSSSVVTSEASNTSSNRSDFSMNLIDEGPAHEDMQDPIDFGQYFEEEYCKASTHDECAELTEAVTDVDSSNSLCDKEKYEEDGDDDDMLGGVFAFSEEGT